MHAALQLLHLEDNRDDAIFIHEALRDQSIKAEIIWVKTKPEFVRRLDSEIDLILADYAIPGFDGLAALALAKEKKREVPFIFVSGKMGEEAAIESLKAGAIDYVLKDRLQRLGSSVRRALREAQESR